MALKRLMLEKDLREATASLEELKTIDFKTREAELEQAIEEAETDEQRSTVEKAVDEFEAEQKENANKIAHLEERISEIEKQINELDEAPKAEERADDTKTEEKHERKVVYSMNRRALDMAPVEMRERIMHDEEVRSFCNEVRELARRDAGITNGDVTIPVVLLDLIKQNIYNYSKLVNRVRVRSIKGEGRQVIGGTVPEAVWTECCAKLNGLAWGFNRVTLDCYKVAGYIPVCNGVLTDSDYDLVAEVIEAIGESIGFALDKAILYGTGTKMPLGIVTRLAQTTQPVDYDPKAPAWADLHTSNIKSIASAIGQAFFSALLGAVAETANPYARGELFFAMNTKTYYKLMGKAIAVNGDGAFVAQVNGRMPVIGGNVDVLEFIPDDNIVCGFGDLYVLGERQGITLSQSEHAMFIEDNTVFKGKARYDGKPAIAKAFAVIGIDGATPTTTMTFASDLANA